MRYSKENDNIYLRQVFTAIIQYVVIQLILRIHEKESESVSFSESESEEVHGPD